MGYRNPIVVLLFLWLAFVPRAGFGAAANTPEDIWKSLEKLPAAEREKKLVEGAKKEGEMIWYTNTGLENANRYIQAFKKNYPFINAQVWRSKTRQVVQRVIAEARAGRYLVDVIKPSTDLVPALLEAKVLANYETPVPGDLPEPSEGILLHEHELRFS